MAMAFGAAAFWASTVQAQVMEIDGEGNVLTRTYAGAVEWQGVGEAQITNASPELIADADMSVPAAAITNIEASYSPQDYKAQVEHAAAVAGISPRLLEALVWQESRWRHSARSPVGAIGLGQLMPGTAKQLKVNPYDPQQNLIGAARYLRQQLDRFNGNVEHALAAYNAGPGNVIKYGGIPPFRETRNYVAVITKRLAATSMTQ